MWKREILERLVLLMPKSKRAKLVSLTQVKEKRKELKGNLIERIRDCLEKYDDLYVFSYENMRTSVFKDVRQHFSDSRFFLGKNRVMQKALGLDEETEIKPSLSSIAHDLVGNVGLFFTSRKQKEISEYFSSLSVPDYARAGFVASEKVTIQKGVLEDMPHTMAETLRKLGMPVKLEKGIVVLTSNYTICNEGDALSPDQGRLLKHFGKLLSHFQLHLLSRWSNGEYSALSEHRGAKKSSSGAASKKRSRQASVEYDDEEDEEEEMNMEDDEDEEDEDDEE
jgi:mRNA turnover protein 4